MQREHGVVRAVTMLSDGGLHIEFEEQRGICIRVAKTLAITKGEVLTLQYSDDKKRLLNVYKGKEKLF